LHILILPLPSSLFLSCLCRWIAVRTSASSTRPILCRAFHLAFLYLGCLIAALVYVAYFGTSLAYLKSNIKRGGSGTA